MSSPAVGKGKKPAKPGASKKHWYEAALDKKKQLEKEQKDMKKATRDATVRSEGPTSNDKKTKQNDKKKK